MRNIFITFFSLFFFLSYAQEETIYTFNVELNHYDNAPRFVNNDDVVIYDGANSSENSFFSNYIILDFYQTYPSSRVLQSLNMFTFVTKNENLMDDLLINYPQKYSNIENLTGFEVVLLDTYPNDFGVFSPVPNLGSNMDLRSFSYINAPKAWDYILGNVMIGISDGKVDNADLDLSNKTNYLPGSPYNTPATYSLYSATWHGTSVAAIAAAQGNNAHGITGVCPNCKILSVPNNYNSLLDLAHAGVKVINMSWASMSTNPNYNSGLIYLPGYGYFSSQQAVIDEIHNMNVTMIAGSGNINSFKSQYAPNYMAYGYPASYNHVISVTALNHLNDFGVSVENDATWGDISSYVEDMVSPSAITNYLGNSPSAFIDYVSNNPNIYYKQPKTTNDLVDISAPGFQVPLYSTFLLGESYPLYGDATSPATPYVTGTVGLMYSLYPCIINDEAEDILKLTSKNLEHIPGNEPFIGRSGSGKLETGDAVEFVSEMMNYFGNAVIDGQDFYRFNFHLENINNKLTISNQIFRDICNADFTARSIIEIMEDTDLKPTTGIIDLKINENIDITCTSGSSSKTSIEKIKKDSKNLNNKNKSLTKLFPNPNNGVFTIVIDDEIEKDVLINVFDVFGKSIYKSSANNSVIKINIPNLSAGVYIVKLSSEDYNETIKFIMK